MWWRVLVLHNIGSILQSFLTVFCSTRPHDRRPIVSAEVSLAGGAMAFGGWVQPVRWPLAGGVRWPTFLAIVKDYNNSQANGCGEATLSAVVWAKFNLIRMWARRGCGSSPLLSIAVTLAPSPPEIRCNWSRTTLRFA